jgi:hypothetical protein
VTHSTNEAVTMIWSGLRNTVTAIQRTRGGRLNQEGDW